MTARQTMHTWELVDGPPVEDPGSDVVAAALSRGQATLWYGSHCFEFTKSVDDHGECLLRLEEVGRRSMTGSGPEVTVFVEHGYYDQQRLAPRRGSLDVVTRRDLDAKAMRAIGESLFADVARAMDVEEGFV